jgi:DNA topoisomerase I
MPKHLVIVESPTKARTLKKFLGRDFVVDSSVGHVRDLPASAADIPLALKKEPWARLGVQVEKDFEPLYVVHPDKKKKIQELKSLLKEVDRLYLATDEDREGEAISWHLREVLQPKVPTVRMVFHEITREAIQQSLKETREIDSHLVSAQEARRIIDRLYGYEVSPILWRKIAPRLSAGRVQSVAIRMLVEREMARMRFRSAGYWDLVASFRTGEGRTFPARLSTIDGLRLAGGKDFDPETGLLARDNVALLDEAGALALVESLRPASFRVLSTEEKPYSQSPPAPFTTSTLQQEGGRKLRFDAKRTMRAAQRLYESGYITYMRTDSCVLSEEALQAARRSVRDLFGPEYLPEGPRFYTSKVKNAQEAHEAIRPAGDQWHSPAELSGSLGPDELRVYELIWMRTLACQMKDARGRRLSVRVGTTAGGRAVVFQANGTAIDFPGFLRAYVEGSDDPEAALADRETILPPVRENEPVTAEEIKAEDHVTSPPPRLTEATLIKALEESGIGRPSTYASIIDTIQRREYTFKKGPALVPTFTAFAVVNLMREHLTDLIDIEFTARMEDRLDSIARGENEALPYLREFYFGDGSPGLRPLLDHKVESIDPRTACTIPLGTDAREQIVAVRVGRFGPYLQRGDDTAPIPDGTCPDEMTVQAAGELLDRGGQRPQSLGAHPETGQPIYLKTGRFGPYVQLGDAGAGPAKGAEDKPGRRKRGPATAKPKMVSLLPGMSPESLTLNEALQLLSLPRHLGQDAEDREVVAAYGRFGAYIKRHTDTRSLGPDDHVLTITLERAMELLAQEKRRRGFRAAAEPIRVFETVAALDGRNIRVLDGRYGPYVTDGKTNASLPRELADPSAVTVEQAVQLILARQDAGPTRRRAGGRAGGARKKTSKTAHKTPAGSGASAPKSGSKARPVPGTVRTVKKTKVPVKAKKTRKS